jgi:hypothetical protein
VTKTDQSTLSERQRKALPYFIASSSEVESCRQAKISKQSYYEWLKEPAFKGELSRLRGLAVEDAVEKLKSATMRSVDVLIGLLDTDSPSIQRSVANDILNHVGKFIELKEIEKRLEGLESINQIKR